MGSTNISYNYNNAMARMVGKDGIAETELSGLQKRALAIHKDLQKKREEKIIGFFDLPYDNLLVQAIMAIANDIKRNFENFVVIGIGGSSLGPACLQRALNHSFHNFLSSQGRRGRPRMFFLDNPDPDSVKGLMEALDLRTTGFNVISKSGGTAETLAIFMHIYNVVQRRFSKTALSKHFIVTTNPDRGYLREVAVADKLKTLPIPENVGGRFSVFSPVGLLPAAVAGINIKNLLSGAAEMDQKCSKPEIMSNPAYLNAAIHYLADTKKGKRISVMMPYSDALKDVAFWYRQLWAESLGKKMEKGKTVKHIGQTPVAALGAVDQHSQIQLYMDGPNDKIVTFLCTKKFRKECKVPRVFSSIEALDHLANQDLGTLLSNEYLATEYALTQNGRPNVSFTMEEINDFNMGALLYLFEVQTAFAAGLYKVNAFDQPGVEQGKNATHTLMGRKSKEDRARMKQFKAYIKERKKYKCL